MFLRKLGAKIFLSQMISRARKICNNPKVRLSGQTIFKSGRPASNVIESVNGLYFDAKKQEEKNVKDG